MAAPNQLNEELSDVSDGVISINTRKVKTDDFKKEKELIDYIVLNIDKFYRDILGDELISFQIEYQLTKQMIKGRREMVDLYIVCVKERYLIEAKNPIYISHNKQGIGQLLNYGRLYLDSKKEQPVLILITTKYDLSTAKTIQHYNLPIRYIYFDKKRTLELRGNGETS